MRLGHLKYVGEKVGEKKSRVGGWYIGCGWEGVVSVQSGGSKKKSQHFCFGRSRG